MNSKILNPHTWSGLSKIENQNLAGKNTPNFAVATTAKQLQPGSNHYTLQVAAYPAGVYTMIIINGNERIARKWVKQT